MLRSVACSQEGTECIGRNMARCSEKLLGKFFWQGLQLGIPQYQTRFRSHVGQQVYDAEVGQESMSVGEHRMLRSGKGEGQWGTGMGTGAQVCIFR